MILWLIIISLLNALCAVPMALRVRYDFALNGRVSLPIAVWSGVTVYVHLTATFALAWLDRGSLSEPSLASLAIGIFAATIGSGLIVAARREYVSRSRAYGLLEDKLITMGIYRYSRNPQYVGLWLMLLGAAIVSLSQWAFLLAFGFAPIFHLYIMGVEEPHLRSAFGEKYLAYCNRTPRYLQLKPRVRGEAGPDPMI